MRVCSAHCSCRSVSADKGPRVVHATLVVRSFVCLFVCAEDNSESCDEIFTVDSIMEFEPLDE